MSCHQAVSIPSCVRTYGQMAAFFRKICGRLALPIKEFLTNLSNKHLKQHLKNCQINMTGCLDRDDLLTAAEKQRYPRSLTNTDHMKLLGLSSTLWKLRTTDTTMEAINIGQRLHDISSGHPLHIHFFLIDLYFEMSMWDDVCQLITKLDHI